MHGLFQGISFRLAKIGILLALVVGLLMSVVEITFDFRSHLFYIDQHISKRLQGSEVLIERALTASDESLLQQSLASLMGGEALVQVKVIDSDSRTLAQLERHIDYSATRKISNLIVPAISYFELPIIYQRATDLSEIKATLVLGLDMDKALQPFYQRAALMLSIGLIRSSLLVLLMLIVFHHLLTKPLNRLVSEWKALKPGTPGNKRLSFPMRAHNDELKQLVISGNQLLDAVDTALSKRQAVEEVLRKSEEHVRQIIDSLPVCVGARNASGHFIFANKALARFLQASPAQIRGTHLAEYARFFSMPVAEKVRQDEEVIRSYAGTRMREETWCGNDGSEYYMHTHMMPMDFYDETVVLSVSSDITELKSTQAQMEYMAYHDVLTGLPNRSYLIEHLEGAIDKAKFEDQYGALMFIDLDQFKTVNDSLGHPAGDGLLKHVAERLLVSVDDKDLVVRLGGDEFVVVLNDVGTDISNAIFRVDEIAERIRTHVSLPYKHQDLQLHVTCSIGIVLFPEEDAGVHELLRYADTAMYHVKEQGRNSVQFFNKYMADTAKNILLMEGDLHRAIETNSFSLHFQPRVDTLTSRIVGAEALLRWNHPRTGMISPSEFIPILETTGLIVEVGMWVLQESIRQIKLWQSQGIWQSGMRLGINISPRQFRSSHFVEEVTRLLEEEHFSADIFEMEITEGIVIHRLDETIATMTILSGLGVHFALDDFGTGYSSISYLKQLPVAVLKIDQSFVRDLTVDRNDRILVETISAMGNMLGLKIVAEGVETLEQLDLVTEYGCHYYQGFLCSVPVPADKFQRMLQQQMQAVELDTY